MACRQTAAIRFRCRMTSLAVFFAISALNAALSSARDVNKMASPRPSSTAAEFLMDYFVPEEIPPDTLVGNVVVDFGLDLKYEPEALRRLQFDFLQPSTTSSAESHAWTWTWTHPGRSSESDVRGQGWQHYRQPQRRDFHETSANGRPPRMAVSGLELFSIDERTGIIRTRIRIDREHVCPSSSTSFMTTAAHRASGSDVCTFKLDIAVLLPADVDSANSGGDDGNVASHVQVI